MNNIIRQAIDDRDRLQTLLFQIAAIILFLYSLILTLAPAVRYHSWQVTYKWIYWIGFIIWIISIFVLNYVSGRKFKNRDPYLLPIISFLYGLGLLTIFRLKFYFWYQTIHLGCYFNINYQHWNY